MSIDYKEGENPRVHVLDGRKDIEGYLVVNEGANPEDSVNELGMYELYDSMKMAMMNASFHNRTVYKCIIPQGSDYYIGRIIKEDRYFGYQSKTINVIEKI